MKSAQTIIGSDIGFDEHVTYWELRGNVERPRATRSLCALRTAHPTTFPVPESNFCNRF